MSGFRRENFHDEVRTALRARGREDVVFTGNENNVGLESVDVVDIYIERRDMQGANSALLQVGPELMIDVTNDVLMESVGCWRQKEIPFDQLVARSGLRQEAVIFDRQWRHLHSLHRTYLMIRSLPGQVKGGGRFAVWR